MKTPNPYLLLLLSSPLVTFSKVPQTPKSDQKLPNIVYILTDDLGYGDITVNNPEAKTSSPNIDRMAKQGIRFTDAHSTSAGLHADTVRYPYGSLQLENSHEIRCFNRVIWVRG